MIVELTPFERAQADASMPKIFDAGFHPERIDWYTRLTVESELIYGGVLVIPEFIAAMICEASLRNRAFGDSDTASPHFGVGWCQFDTEYHVPSLSALIAIRTDPLYSLKYIANPVNGLTSRGGHATHFNKQAWHAWEDKTIDPLLDETGQPTGWSALGAAHAAWDRVTST